ncbi:MAG: hypothetical protein EBY39_09395 [Flavobacteriia bacterium]|nr:hypothetical protein [Flavobacteriia bacterium]
MKPQFQHELTTSFMLWADNFITNTAEAYQNYTSPLYPMDTDDQLGEDFVTYSSPHKQWVFDESVEGAQIPSGIYNNGEFIERGENGLILDFDDGRVILDSSFGANNTTLSGQYSVKEFNFYITNQTEEQLIIDSKFDSNGRFKQELSGIAPHKQVIPAIFVNPELVQNEAFAFGGEDKTTTNIRCVIFAENTFQLDGALSVFTDSKNEVFSKLDFSDYPLNEFGDVTGFNYKTVATEKKSRLFHIEDVRASKLSDRVSKNIDQSLFIGFLDFEVTNLRFPRQ